GPAIEAHCLAPAMVLRLAAAMGGQVGRLLLVGCEPTPPGEADEMTLGMGDPVRAAVDEAVPLVEALVAKLLSGEAIGAREGGFRFGEEGGPCRSGLTEPRGVNPARSAASGGGTPPPPGGGTPRGRFWDCPWRGWPRSGWAPWRGTTWARTCGVT